MIIICHTVAHYCRRPRALPLLARKKKLNEKNKETPTKPTKPTRRGKGAGLREIERKILKENKN